MKTKICTCIFCNKVFSKRKNGDHIISQSLGVFNPGLKVKEHICFNCDSKNGASFEGIFSKTGIIGIFRNLKKIKSKNRNGKSSDFSNCYESKYFKICKYNDENELFDIAEDNSIRYSERINVIKNNKIIDKIYIPPAIIKNIREKCNFIEAKTSLKIENIVYEIALNCYESVKELKRRGIILSINKIENPQENFEILLFDSLITLNHFRFITYTVLKAMLRLNYPLKFLNYMINFVKTGKKDFLLNQFVCEEEMKLDILNNSPLSSFYHCFEWEIGINFIKISASIFTDENKQSILKIKMFFRTCFNNSEVVPFGKVIAKYGKTLDDGVLELFKGDLKIN